MTNTVILNSLTKCYQMKYYSTIYIFYYRPYLSSQSAGELRLCEFQSIHIFLFNQDCVWANSRRVETVSDCRRAKITGVYYAVLKLQLFRNKFQKSKNYFFLNESYDKKYIHRESVYFLCIWFGILYQIADQCID